MQGATLLTYTGKYPPLEQVATPAVNTDQAAYYLSRKPQTLRTWHCKGIGPIKPLNVGGRLAWAVPDIRKLLGV